MSGRIDLRLRSFPSSLQNHNCLKEYSGFNTNRAQLTALVAYNVDYHKNRLSFSLKKSKNLGYSEVTYNGSEGSQ